MTGTSVLRARISSALGLGLLLSSLAPIACGHSSDEDEQSVQPTSCGSQEPQVQCWAPGEAHFAIGNVPQDSGIATPVPMFDSNGCQVAEQAADGCCNPAVTGPQLIDGQCCYGFCTGACCGRPLLVDGEPRLAPTVERDDWLLPLGVTLSASELEPELRARIAELWLADARLEHASIASFARFTLDLLAVAAPAELVELAQQAMADEIRHARSCFALASLYRGVPCGPGALVMAGVVPSASLLEAAVAAVREGCVDETIAALSAVAQARRTSNSGLRRLLEGIAADEARHAELAWRFVAWACEHGGALVRSAVADTFREASRAAPQALAASTASPALAAHGRLTDAEALEVRRAALGEVIAPCARVLLQSVAARVVPGAGAVHAGEAVGRGAVAGAA